MTPPADDYCELCELPRSTCVHGNPPAAPVPATRAAPAPRTRAVRQSATKPPSRPVVRKWTPTEEFRPHILRILTEADGRLDDDDLMLELEARLEEALTPGDRERSPQGGDRWHVAVRKQRKALIDEGLLVPAQPGVWQLTPQGLAGQ